jgi:acyl carrier protein
MKATREELLDIIYQCLDGLNEQLANGDQIQKSMEAPLVGGREGLDSLGLVNFVALVEEECARKYGIAVSLTDPSPQEDDRFANIGKFVDFLFQRLNDNLL